MKKKLLKLILSFSAFYKKAHVREREKDREVTFTEKGLDRGWDWRKWSGQRERKQKRRGAMRSMAALPARSPHTMHSPVSTSVPHAFHTLFLCNPITFRPPLPHPTHLLFIQISYLSFQLRDSTAAFTGAAWAFISVALHQALGDIKITGWGKGWRGAWWRVSFFPEHWKGNGHLQ